MPGIKEDTSFNRVRFFLESLNDIDIQLKARGGKLHFIKGDPTHVFEAIHKARPLKHVAFEQVSLNTYAYEQFASGAHAPFNWYYQPLYSVQVAYTASAVCHQLSFQCYRTQSQFGLEEIVESRNVLINWGLNGLKKYLTPYGILMK